MTYRWNVMTGVKQGSPILSQKNLRNRVRQSCAKKTLGHITAASCFSIHLFGLKSMFASGRQHVARI